LHPFAHKKLIAHRAYFGEINEPNCLHSAFLDYFYWLFSSPQSHVLGLKEKEEWIEFFMFSEIDLNCFLAYHGQKTQKKSW